MQGLKDGAGGRAGTRIGIGPIGMAARLVVGALLIGLALFSRDPDWGDVVLGLVIMPALVIGALTLRARRVDSDPMDAKGPLGHLVNAVVFVPLLFFPATAGAAFLFYGASMIVAAVRRTGGCEVTAISNFVLRRTDEVGCVLFGPVDYAEAGATSRHGAASARSRRCSGPAM